MKRLLKKMILGEGRKGRRVPLGLYRGLMLVIAPTVDSTYYLGLYERETSPWLRKAGKAVKSVVDIGAGYGELAVWGLDHENVLSVVAYDPGPRWDTFRENLRLNDRESDSRLLAGNDFFFGDHRRDEDARAVAALPEPVLFRIDVDGGEAQILERLLPAIQAKRCLFLIETHSLKLDEICGRVLRQNGYSVDHIPRAWWRRILRENRSLEFNQWLVAEKRQVVVPQPSSGVFGFANAASSRASRQSDTAFLSVVDSVAATVFFPLGHVLLTRQNQTFQCRPTPLSPLDT